jgi:phosphohistidine phosphatase SixA
MGVSRRGLGILLAMVFTVASGLVAQETVVTLVRHAERQSLWDDDSPLSEAGLRRAQALAALLAEVRPAVLYTSDRQRTRQTLAPTAARLGLAPRVRPKDGTEALAAEILAELRGKTVVVCWHHDLMKKLARGLGVKGPVPHWSLDAYDRLWIVRVPAQGEATLEERHQDLSKPRISAPGAATATAAQPR